jgi:predicted ribosomally synthesized peptide with SipW-like signal peptide
MKKILLSITSIIFAGAILAGGTGAFFNSQNTSTGNTFATGIIDLKVDNESYVTNDVGKLVFSPSTSWALSGLAGKLFFNFPDIKPGDVGEDTISLHVANNNAWACMNITLTGTPENGQSEPEALVDTTTGINDGELQHELYFAFWADDGDNVYETNEKLFKQGLVKNLFNGESWALSDSQSNIWSPPPWPIQAGATKYIAKAWCFGVMGKTPITQDGLGKTGSNGPLARGTGFTCDGRPLGNILQSDGIIADVAFTVVQSRNNPDFICGKDELVPPPQTATLLVDNFEAYNIGFDLVSNPKWVDQGGVQAIWGLDGKVGDLDAGTNAVPPNNAESLTSQSLDMSIYHDITLKYDRKSDDTSGAVDPQTLKVEYSVNGGGVWTTLETITGETVWTTKTFSLSPSANNKPNVKIRFVLTGTNSTNHAFIDNVSITGITP